VAFIEDEKHGWPGRGRMRFGPHDLDGKLAAKVQAKREAGWTGLLGIARQLKPGDKVLRVRFQYKDGDELADVLFILRDGKVAGWSHNGSSFDEEPGDEWFRAECDFLEKFGKRNKL